MHHPTDRIVHTTVFVTPIVAHWVPHEWSIQQPIKLQVDVAPQSCISLLPVDEHWVQFLYPPTPYNHK